MNPLKWLRPKPEPVPPPPVDFAFPLEELPAAAIAKIKAGAAVTLRQYRAVRVSKGKYRSRCSLLLDGEWAADTHITWEQPEV